MIYLQCFCYRLHRRNPPQGITTIGADLSMQIASHGKVLNALEWQQPG